MEETNALSLPESEVGETSPAFSTLVSPTLRLYSQQTAYVRHVQQKKEPEYYSICRLEMCLDHDDFVMGNDVLTGDGSTLGNPRTVA